MKVYKILIITIIVLFIILGIKIHTGKQKYSLQDIKNILDKANNIENYECIVEEKYKLYFKSYKKKGNIVCKEDRISKRIYNYELNSYTYLCNSGTNGEKFYIEDTISSDEYNITSNSYSGGISPDNILLLENIEIINIKDKKFKGNNCIKITFKITAENIPVYFQDGKEYFKANLWLNKDNGLIMKIQDAETKKEFEPKYKFNTVTDEDVNPDLSHYRNSTIYN